MCEGEVWWLGVGGGVVIPCSTSVGNGTVCVCLPRLKCHVAAGPFDLALMSPQYVSLSGSRAPLHIPLIGKRNMTKTLVTKYYYGAGRHRIPVEAGDWERRKERNTYLVVVFGCNYMVTSFKSLHKYIFFILVAT